MDLFTLYSFLVIYGCLIALSSTNKFNTSCKVEGEEKLNTWWKRALFAAAALPIIMSAAGAICWAAGNILIVASEILLLPLKSLFG